jgi:23S rRNA pseudouridine1911/1915/1917 synthase
MEETAWTATAADAGTRLDKFLADRSRLGSRGRATTAIDRGKVFVNDVEAATRDAARLLEAGDRVRLWMDRPGSARSARVRTRREGALEIVYEDADLLVVNKPPGLLTVPLGGRDDRSLADLVASHVQTQGKRPPRVVHRIDRDTSGLVVFAKTGKAFADLKGQFERREPERRYLAVVHGEPTPPRGAWRDWLTWDRDELIQRVAHDSDRHGKEAVSEYEVTRPLAKASVLEVRLVTGKRNQIRVQAALRGCPLVGEKQYTTHSAPIPFPRQALHAWRLGFTHPITRRAMSFEAPLPDDLVRLIARLTPGGRSARAPRDQPVPRRQ